MNILWVIFYAIGQILIVVNGKVLSKSSSHLVTLDASEYYCNGFFIFSELPTFALFDPSYLFDRKRGFGPVVYIKKLFGGNLDFPKIKKLKQVWSDIHESAQKG